MPLRAWAHSVSFPEGATMTEYNYQLCGVRVRVNAARPVREDEQAALFHAGAGKADLTLHLHPTGELSADFPKNATRVTRREGAFITRLTRDPFRTAPHISVRSSLAEPGWAEVFARADCWEWATQSQFFWPGIALPQLLLPFRALIFHASCIACHGGAILFTAPSGTGKSTQAELWRTHRGAEIINGDKAGITLGEVPMAHGVPFSGTSGICQNRSLPLRGMVVLRQAPENAIRRLSPSGAVAALCPNLFADRAVSEEWSMALNLLLDLTAAVPVYDLGCTPDVGAVECLEGALKEDTP